MEPKKVLVIGMVDSIHLARWLSQFVDYKIDFVILPSKKFKNVHPQIQKMIKNKNVANYCFVEPYFPTQFLGYIDYGITNLAKLFKINWRSYLLNKALNKKSFTYIHAIEIQGAGYLCTEVDPNKFNNSTLIITNYGNDIFFFQNLPDHLSRIKIILRLADQYSAECSRDYELALKYGFDGKFLPLIPNSGGVANNVFDMNLTSSDKRNLIIAKCYGGELGLGSLIIEALIEFLTNNPNVKVLLHSVTDDLVSKCENLHSKYPDNVQFFTVKNKIPRERLLEYMSKSRVYIGACKSDGISTSFLEAVCLGAYPIQTNTSCAGDWVNLGFKGEIVEPTKNSILTALANSYNNPDLEIFRRINLYMSRENLNFQKIKEQAQQFYGLS